MRKKLGKMKIFGGLGLLVLLLAVFLSSMLPAVPTEPQDTVVLGGKGPKEEPDVIRI